MKSAYYILIFLSILSLIFLTGYCEENDDHNIYNGYYDSFGSFTPGYISNDTWLTPAPQYISGKLVFYGPYAMDATAEYRGINYEEYGCIGGVSLMSPRDIGKKAWIEIENGKWLGPYCVVDCARRGDMYSIVVHRDEVIEVEYSLAEELGMVETNSDYTYEVNEWYKNVNVYVQDCTGNYIDPDVIIEEPVDYSEWFLENVEFIEYQESNVQPSDNFSYWRVNGGDAYYFNSFMYRQCEYDYFEFIDGDLYRLAK